MILFLGATVVTASQQRLVVERYPGSVEVAFWGEETGLDRDAGFYAKEDIQEVRKFYERKYGPMSRRDLYSYMFDKNEAEEESGSYLFSRVIMDREEVADYVKILPEPAGVELQALDPGKHTASYTHRAVEPYFERLRQVVAIGDAGEKEYRTAEERYRHLAWSYYQKTEERDDSGRRLAMDQVIYNGCRNRQQQGMNEVELAAKLQQLYMAGKFEEAQKLSENIGGQGSWDRWIGCLEELESHAYKTLIVIHKHPSIWEE